MFILVSAGINEVFMLIFCVTCISVSLPEKVLELRKMFPCLEKSWSFGNVCIVFSCLEKSWNKEMEYAKAIEYAEAIGIICKSMKMHCTFLVIQKIPGVLIFVLGVAMP